MEKAMGSRHRFKQTAALQARLATWAEDIRAQAEQLPPGPERDALLKKASQADIACHLDDWVNSPGLQAPK